MIVADIVKGPLVLFSKKQTIQESRAMTPQDEQMIRQAHFLDIDPPPAIILANNDGSKGNPLAGFCDRIKALSPHLGIKKESDSSFSPPALVTGRHRNIGYRAVPTGKILELFLEAIQGSTSDSARIAPPIEDLLKQIDLPVVLKLYAAAQCPHCPRSIRQLQSLAAHSPLIRLSVTDAELFSEEAQADQIRSVPTLILDDQMRWTGPVNIEELLSFCIKRDPSQLSAASLRQLIEAGEAARVSNMMAQSGRLFPALAELLVHARWSVRLGAMVTAEYLAENAPNLSLQLCELLWKQFDRIPPQVQGDVVQVLGQLDTEITRGFLKSVISAAYEADVTTAAMEVLADMENLSHPKVQ